MMIAINRRGVQLAGVLIAVVMILFSFVNVLDARSNKQDVCHVPPGNPGNAHTIRINTNAVDAHLDHGDYLGPCGEQPDVDTDDDGLTDNEEISVYGTDPLNADTDGDGLTDGEEVLVHNTDPLDVDTDDGGVIDGEEVYVYGTNPLDPFDDFGGGSA